MAQHDHGAASVCAMWHLHPHSRFRRNACQRNDYTFVLPFRFSVTMDLPDLVVVDERKPQHPWQLEQEDFFNDEDVDPPLSKEGGLSILVPCIERCLVGIARRRPSKTGLHAKGTARARTHASM